MELNQTTFAKTLEELKEKARQQDNMIAKSEIEEAFSEWRLGENELSLIQNYFRENKIGIDEAWNVDDNLTGEDADFLKMYLDELDAMPPVSDGLGRAIRISALAGDTDARSKLIGIFLPEVVGISKLYAGQGVLVEDLIGEGNVAVASAVSMLGCVENAEEVDGFIARMVMDAMEELIRENDGNRRIDDTVLSRVNDVNDKAKELYDSLLRKVSVGEVAKELGITPEAVREAVRLSAERIEYIDINA